MKTQTVQEMVSLPCEKCNAIDYEVTEKDIIDFFEDAASKNERKG